jgi:hypothetical protein
MSAPSRPLDGDVRPPGVRHRAFGPSARPRPQAIFFAPVSRRLARKNIMTGLIVSGICMFMFGLTFVVAAIYIS